MKHILQTALLPAILISLMLAIPASAVESYSTPSTYTSGTSGTSGTSSTLAQASSNEISFQIPMHDFCSVENAFDFRLQLSNTSGQTANVTLYLYHKDGSLFNEEGTSYNGMESSIAPGTPMKLKGNATELYHMNFGNHKKCDERIYSGKIVANSGQASLLATGWVNRRLGEEIKQTEIISIHGNSMFKLEK
jgi:hypothetical protein